MALVLVGCGGSPRGVDAPSPPEGRVRVRAEPRWRLEPVDPRVGGSAVALGRVGGATFAFVSDEDERAVQVVDLDRGEQVASTAVDGRPGQLLITGDGRLLVTLSERARLAVFELGGSSEPELLLRRAVQTAEEPVGLAATPDGATVVVTSRWGRSLDVFSGAALERRARVPLARDPYAVTLSDGGAEAFVTHVVGSRMSVVTLGGTPSVREISLDTRLGPRLAALARAVEKAPPQARKPVRFGDFTLAVPTPRRELRGMLRSSGQGYALAKSVSLGRVFLPSAFVDPGRATERTGGYGDQSISAQIAGVPVLDDSAHVVLGASVELEHRAGVGPGASCLLPRAAATLDSAELLLVGCLGLDALVAYDAASAKPVVAEVHRWPVASGPVGIAVDTQGPRAVVWSQFEHVLSVIPLAFVHPSAAHATDIVEIPIQQTLDGRLATALAVGRMLFHAAGDSRISRDGRACASCHPSGRDDGLVWSTPDGPRRTKLLAGGLKGTEPFSWDGQTEDLNAHLHQVVSRLRGSGDLRRFERRALLAYVESLPGPPRLDTSPHAQIERGRAVFESAGAGCGRCHRGEPLTDNREHDVASRTPADDEDAFNTPSLRHLVGRAPFFHDGRYPSLRDLLVDVDGTMGRTAHLSPDDLGALEAYLGSL